MVDNARAYHSLSKMDRLLKLSGAPIAALKKKFDLDAMRFSQMVAKTETNARVPTVVEAPEQFEFYKSLLLDPSMLTLGGVYIFGSHPTEDPAKLAAAELCRKYQDLLFSKGEYPRLKWVDTGFPDWDFLRGGSGHIGLGVISGINAQSDAKRLSIARDFHSKFSGATVFITLSATNALEFAVQHLGVYPDAIFQLGKPVTRAVV